MTRGAIAIAISAVVILAANAPFVNAFVLRAEAAAPGAFGVFSHVEAPDLEPTPDVAPDQQVPSASADAAAEPAAQPDEIVRLPFLSEIEQWRPLVRQVLAEEKSQGKLGGPAEVLDEDVVLSLIQHESAGDPEANSDAGAIGLMQLMPETFAAELYGDPSRGDALSFDVIADPQRNVRAGIGYLVDAANAENGNLYWILASYNAGIGAVDDWRSVGLRAVPPLGGYTETAAYAPAILRTLAHHRPGLAVSIPDPMTDDEADAAEQALEAAGLW